MDTAVPDLQRALETVGRKRPTLRLVAAIAHENGVSQSELAEWFDVERKTVYNWLGRFEGGDPVAAARDDRRPGRPPKLSDADRSRLLELLGDPPQAVDVDAPAWTTGLLQEFLHERFGVEYSPSSCRRLLREAGLCPLEETTLPDRIGRERRGGSDADGPRHGHPWVPE